MAATETAQNWNNQWWREVVRRQKNALPPLLNVRAKKPKKKKSA